MKYEIIDQQWVATPEEADAVVRHLAPFAQRYGFLIGRRAERDGFLLTVEKPVPEEDEDNDGADEAEPRTDPQVLLLPAAGRAAGR
jgi:hypothetical protein